jgi:hypothetical protein
LPEAPSIAVTTSGCEPVKRETTALKKPLTGRYCV